MLFRTFYDQDEMTTGMVMDNVEELPITATTEIVEAILLHTLYFSNRFEIFQLFKLFQVSYFFI